MIMVAVVYGQLLQVAAVKLSGAAPTDPGIQFERLFSIAFRSPVSVGVGIGDDLVQFFVIEFIGHAV